MCEGPGTFPGAFIAEELVAVRQWRLYSEEINRHCCPLLESINKTLSRNALYVLLWLSACEVSVRHLGVGCL
jgi:hypothetical protein